MEYALPRHRRLAVCALMVTQETIVTSLLPLLGQQLRIPAPSSRVFMDSAQCTKENTDVNVLTGLVGPLVTIHFIYLEIQVSTFSVQGFQIVISVINEHS